MNTQPTEKEMSMADYLSAVASSNLIDGYVDPKEEVARRIEREVSRQCQCTPQSLAIDHALKRTQELNRFTVSAKPEAFVEETVAAITRISEALSEKRASTFEIAFRNVSCEPNLWRDRMFIGVRYMT